MHRRLPLLARTRLELASRSTPCLACRNNLSLSTRAIGTVSSPRPLGTAFSGSTEATRATGTGAGTLVRSLYRPQLQQQHSTAQFSTASIRHAIKTMTLDDLEDDASSSRLKRRKPFVVSQTSPESSTTASSSTAAAAAATTSEPIDSLFLDSTIIPPEPIKAYRELYEEIRHSSEPQDLERLLAAYRDLADDPELLSQLQPIDFMFALNSCRDLLHVIPRMRRILDDVDKTSHADVPEIWHILLKAYIKMSDFTNCANTIDFLRQRNIEFNTSTYHILLQLCKHQRKLRDAVGLLAQMRKRGVEVTEHTYLLMMTICGRVKDYRAARQYFDEMPSLGLEQNVTHYNALMNAYAQAKDAEGARRVFEMMEDDGIQMDQYTYAAMIKAYRARGRYSEASSVLEGMIEEKNWPNVNVLSAMAMDPWRIASECNKHGVELSQHDFGILIIQAIRMNRFPNVHELMQLMQEYGHRPNVYIFTAMIDADLKMGKYKEAKEVFNAMQRANIQPDVIAYSAMISGALSQAGVKESMEILQAMVGDGLLPNLHTFNSLLSACVGEIGIDSFKIIRETMDSLHVRPDNRSFNALLSAYALQGDMDEMLRAFDDMKRSRVRPDALTYSILISGFLQNGDLRYAMEWYYKMMEGGHIPATFVINNLMAALHGSGQGQQVLVMWHEMDRIGIKKTEQSYEIALEACEKYGLDDALPQIEEELKIFLARRMSPSQ
ncbi:hypothetical protein BGZ99_009827 [Dissophora globulifera]|uniref:Pentacotripeptide-repeat region of PRORP domain-containing protein n=1 Tax=Dissophora globulifera TaxID=979702 RepID=A0A9P6R3L0_9FUNG|nr:hypothetical protein BGZ99_009827 [Dissophora globulifera]